MKPSGPESLSEILFRAAAAAGLVLLASASASAANLSREELIARLRVRGDVFVVSEDGKTLRRMGQESRVISGFSPEGKYKRDWSSNSSDTGSYRLRHEWTISPEGAIRVKFTEFAEEEIDSRSGLPTDFKNPIGTEEKEIVDFGAIQYAVKASKGNRLLIRFVPELAESARAETVGPMRLIGRGISIYDAEGALWASDLDLGAEYSAISTHRGTLVLSYAPFKGAEPAGVAAGKKITIRMRDYPRVTLQSDTDFLPQGMNGQVYVRYLKDKRTGALNSVRLQETSSEKRMLERLKK